MKISYQFFDQQDLYEKDSSLSLGWFIINDTDVIKETLCMVTISLTDLARGMNHLFKYKSGGFNWHPADSGKGMIFRRSGKEISFHYNDHYFKTTFGTLYNSVYDVAEQHLKDLTDKREQVKEEGAYQDLEAQLKNRIR